MIANSLLALASLLSLAISGARALPTVETRTSITALTSSQISAFKPYTHYASTGYCRPSTTLAWNCGANCNANADFKPVTSGGDGDSVQFWYVGYDPTLKTVIVAHQGTDTSEIEPLLTDADIVLDQLDTSLFSGVSSSVKVHSGFADEHAKTATTVLSAVKSAISKYSATHVTLVGHSLGVSTTHVNFVPTTNINLQVGNQAFADYVDAHVTSLTRINNREDFIPILPGRFLGFHHPSGEVHITDSSVWESCPGQDNTSSHCTTGDVSNIFDGNTSDHSGPYDGVEMGC